MQISTIPISALVWRVLFGASDFFNFVLNLLFYTTDARLNSFMFFPASVPRQLRAEDYQAIAKIKTSQGPTLGISKY